MNGLIAEVVMYLDGVVIFGLVIVALVCVMAVYLSVYAYKHFQADVEREEGKKHRV
jgi:hypothetical protein